MKKIRIILCFCLMLSLCFGGCGNPSQNSSGDSSERDSSKQEDSSQKEDSKTEVSSKVENSSKAEVSSKPAESSKVEDSSKAEVSSKPEESSVSEESSVAQESSVKEESSQLEESSQAEISSTPEESSPSEAGWAAAYLDIVEDLQVEYGEGKTVVQGENECFVGLVVASLIDFDADGQLELFCGYLSEDEAFAGVAYQRVYGYVNGEAQLWFDEPAGMRGGTNPGTDIRTISEGTAFIIMYDSAEEDYLMLEGSQFVAAHHVTRDPRSWDGVTMSDQQFLDYEKAFWEGGNLLVSVRYNTTHLCNGLKTLTDTQETIETLRQLAE